MTDNDNDPVPVTLPEGRFEGRVAFQQLVRDALACAAQEGWNEIILSDASFEDWPLGERAVVESLLRRVNLWEARDLAGPPLRRRAAPACALRQLAGNMGPPDRMPWLPCG